MTANFSILTKHKITEIVYDGKIAKFNFNETLETLSCSYDGKAFALTDMSNDKDFFDAVESIGIKLVPSRMYQLLLQVRK